MAGYSGTPLARKLGIKAGALLHAVHPPANYMALLDPLPENVTFARNVAEELDLVHLFTKTRSELVELLDQYQAKIKQNGAIWVSWPKKSIGSPLGGHRRHGPRGRPAPWSGRHQSVCG